MNVTLTFFFVLRKCTLFETALHLRIYLTIIKDLNLAFVSTKITFVLPFLRSPLSSRRHKTRLTKEYVIKDVDGERQTWLSHSANARRPWFGRDTARKMVGNDGTRSNRLSFLTCAFLSVCSYFSLHNSWFQFSHDTIPIPHEWNEIDAKRLEVNI